MAGHTVSWLMSLELQCLVIIGLIQKQHKTGFIQPPTKILGNDTFICWNIGPREWRDCIVLNHCVHELDKLCIDIEERKFVVGCVGLGTWYV